LGNENFVLSLFVAKTQSSNSNYCQENIIGKDLLKKHTCHIRVTYNLLKIYISMNQFRKFRSEVWEGNHKEGKYNLKFQHDNFTFIIYISYIDFWYAGMCVC
jgi:hypothetical protein